MFKVNNNTISSDYAIITTPGMYKIAAHFSLTFGDGIFPNEITTNLMANKKVISTKLTECSGASSNEWKISAEFDYETILPLEEGQEIWVDALFDQDIYKDYRVESASMQIQLVEADNKGYEVENSNQGGSIELKHDHSPSLLLTTFDPNESHMIRFYGQDENGNQIETVAFNCHTGAVTINNDNKSITEDAKDFWRAVATAFPEVFKDKTITPKESDHEAAWNRAMGILKNG